MIKQLVAKKGFTIVELITVIAIIGVLTAIALPAYTAVRVKGRNAQRSSDVSTIMNAVYQYAVDNNNQLPSTLTSSSTEICKTGAPSCVGYIDLSVLTTNQKYASTLPNDPLSTSTSGTGYTISKNIYSRVVVAAPKAESGVVVSITR